MISCETGQPLETELVLCACGITVVGLQQADDVFIEIPPPSGARRVLGDVLCETLRRLSESRHVQISGENIEQRRNVGAALNRRVAAKRHDAASRTPHVAEQELQDGGAADDLHAGRVLRPADRVTDSAGLLWT